MTWKNGSRCHVFRKLSTHAITNTGKRDNATFQRGDVWDLYVSLNGNFPTYVDINSPDSHSKFKRYWRDFLIGYEFDSSKHEADHDVKMLQSIAWLMTILWAKNITVGIVSSWSCRGPDLESSIPGEIAYYTHGTVITQNRRWKYLLPTTTSKIVIRHHH